MTASAAAKASPYSRRKNCLFPRRCIKTQAQCRRVCVRRAMAQACPAFSKGWKAAACPSAIRPMEFGRFQRAAWPCLYDAIEADNPVPAVTLSTPFFSACGPPAGPCFENPMRTFPPRGRFPSLSQPAQGVRVLLHKLFPANRSATRRFSGMILPAYFDAVIEMKGGLYQVSLRRYR